MAEKETMTEWNSTDGEESGSFDDAELALTGIKMLLNNGFEEARQLFEKYKYAYVFLHF